ncbi:CG13183, partial [Drosophila busckii]
MISRRKIISRSLDNLDAIGQDEQEEDVWHDREKLFRDHINEVLAKWEQIDDEIWAKIIVFEKNRRVAKAYARSSVITINGSKHGFDGVRIGLNGFENPMRDAETKVIKKSIGDGFKIKMDDTGNIYIKRYGKSSIFVNNTSLANEETVIGADIMQMPQMGLSAGTSAKLFDMKKFQTNINREFARSYPERSRLERQCLSAVSLVKSSNSLISTPVWIMVVNVVAMDMLKNHMQSLPKSMDALGMRVPLTQATEDPYSTIESQVGLIYPTPAASDDSQNSSSSSSKGRRSIFSAGFINETPYMPKPDYEVASMPPVYAEKKRQKSTQERKKQDDPYYCGLLARIPNFIKSSKQPCASKPKKEPKISRKISAQHHNQFLLAAQQQQQQQHMATPIPIATFHHSYFPYKLYPPQHRLSQSQMSLWDARSLISAHG